MGVSRHVRKNRRYWDRTSEEYQRVHGRQLARGAAWGVWSLPERRLRILGDVSGKDILELGCGAAEWSIHLARAGARPIALDLSSRQLAHARRLMAAAGVSFPLVNASAEELPFADGKFDVVFCDHGATSFADPRRTVPEAARLLRDEGLLAFNMASPFLHVCWSPETERVEERLHAAYFGMRRFEYEEDVEFQLPYGEWIRLFRDAGLLVEDLVELRPPESAETSYEGFAPLEWARRWPAENVWKVRKG